MYTCLIHPVLFFFLLADKKMVPIENYGVKCMSIGLLVEKDAPLIWRGPMVFIFLPIYHFYFQSYLRLNSVVTSLNPQAYFLQ